MGFDKTSSSSSRNNGRRSDIELMWRHAVSNKESRDMNCEILDNPECSNFTPHLAPLSPTHGPSSLPVELISSAQRDVRQLQELRRYIQEECDQLLLKKERLKEEVGTRCLASSSLWLNGGKRSSMSPDLSVKHNLRERSGSSSLLLQPLHPGHLSIYDGCQKPSDPAFSSCNSLLSSPTDDLFSIAQAHKIVLTDIAREKMLVEKQMEQQVKYEQFEHNSLDHTLMTSLKQKLTLQFERCNKLQSALSLQQEQAHRVLEASRSQHLHEISQLEAMVSSSQDLVRRQTKKFTEQVDKLVMADTVIEQLIVDNHNLTVQLNRLKEIDKFDVTQL